MTLLLITPSAVFSHLGIALLYIGTVLTVMLLVLIPLGMWYMNRYFKKAAPDHVAFLIRLGQIALLILVVAFVIDASVVYQGVKVLTIDESSGFLSAVLVAGNLFVLAVGCAWLWDAWDTREKILTKEDTRLDA